MGKGCVFFETMYIFMFSEFRILSRIFRVFPILFGLVKIKHEAGEAKEVAVWFIYIRGDCYSSSVCQ